MSCIPVSAVLLLTIVVSSLAYRDGARLESCYDHRVEHDAFPPPVPEQCDGDPGCTLGGFRLIGEVDPSNFSIMIDDSVTTLLTCGSVYRFETNGLPNLGYLIQARDADTFMETSNLWGEWMTYPDSPYRVLECGRNSASTETLFPNSVTQANILTTDTGNVDFYWTPPNATVQLRFFWTIVSGFSSYFLPQRSQQYSVICGVDSTTAATTAATTTETTPTMGTTPLPPATMTLSTTETTRGGSPMAPATTVGTGGTSQGHRLEGTAILITFLSAFLLFLLH